MAIKSRLMDRPEDYAKLGLKKGMVEVWEDGRRDFSKIGACEWWYFDAIFDDGTSISISVHTRSPLAIDHEGDCPLVTISIELPDGRKILKYDDCTHKGLSCSTTQCDVAAGPHRITGDLKTYQIHIDPIDNCGLDLTLESESTSWRPETGYFVFGDDEELFFTWLCVVPRGKMEGTITFDGEIRQVTGIGYHDHQWTNHPRPNTLWNHWIWGRQHMDDYTLLLFDFNHAKQYGYVRYPLLFVQDRQGRIIFDNSSPDDLDFEVLQESDYHTYGKDYPEVMRYRFKKNGVKVEYVLSADNVLLSEYRADRYSPALQKELDEMGFCWTYMHYLGHGKLTFDEGNGPVSAESDLIYELSYFGKSYKAPQEDKEN